MANRFWVGGTGTWDAADTTHWASSSNGAGGQTVPGSSDQVIFDASSGGGTVTVNHASLTVQGITCGAFTGTLDFSANNNNVSINTATGFSGSGSGTRTINLGNGTWTLSVSNAAWSIATTTNLTFNANSSTIAFSNVAGTAARTFSGGGLTYSTLSIGSNTSGGAMQILGSNTFATLSITAPNMVVITNGVTQIITNAFTWTGSSSNQIAVESSSFAAVTTLSVATGSPTMSWANLRFVACTGGATFTATNSFNSGGNSGITITAPSDGSGISRARAASGF